MNRQQFLTWMNEPSSLDEESTAGLQQLVKDYPYFQAARVLHLLNLKKMKDYRFEPELRQVAAYAADRARLREWIGYIEDLEHPVEKHYKAVHSPVPAEKHKPEDPRLHDLEEQIKDSLMEIEKKNPAARTPGRKESHCRCFRHPGRRGFRTEKRNDDASPPKG